MKTMDYLDLSEGELTENHEKIRAGYESGEIVGHDVSLHICRLANSAFRSGRRVYVDLLLDWMAPEALSNPEWRMASVLEAVLRTGFWQVAESVFHTAADANHGRRALQQLLSGTFIGVGLGYVEIDLSPADRDQSLSLLQEQRPWVSEAHTVVYLKQVFSDFVARQRARAGGGWDTALPVAAALFTSIVCHPRDAQPPLAGT